MNGQWDIQINIQIERQKLCTTELRLRGGIKEKSEIIFLFLNKNICCDPSLEWPQ